MKKKMTVLVFIFIFSLLMSSLNITVVEAASTTTTQSNSIEGWENWKPGNYANGGIKLYCPYEGATVADIFYYINKLISENMGNLNERYGEALYRNYSFDLIFTRPDFGEHPEEACANLYRYLNSVTTFYSDKPIEFEVWNNTTEKDKGLSEIEIGITSNGTINWSGYTYNPSTGAYEAMGVGFYDSLDDIKEYKAFGTRTGTWVEDTWIQETYQLRNIGFVQSQFEIFDGESFDRTILNQTHFSFDSITNINGKYVIRTDGKYVLVKHMSVFIVEPVVQSKIHDLCENAKKASDTQTGQLKYINDYLCSHVKYDYDYYNWIISDSGTPYVSKNDVLPNNAYGALIVGCAICTGFTSAMEELCNYLGIPNFHIDNGTHAWNMVYVDNQWKMLDVTWNATGDNTTEYFLVDNITEPSGSHIYDPTEIEMKKEDTIAYWKLKNTCAKYFEYSTQHQQIIKQLVDKGIFVGNDKGELNLHKGLTRAELATVLTRLSGQENSVKEKSQYYASINPFIDVPTWAVPYVGYCYEQGLLKGYSNNMFGANDTVNVKMACTVILRYMGYKETDWRYDSSVEKAKSIGIIPGLWPTGTTALRNDIALMINYALTNKSSTTV